MKRTTRVILLALAALLVAALLPASGVLANGTIVLVNPPSQSVNVNGTTTVEIKVDTVSNLYGVDVRLTFDAAKLEAQDANASLTGVQVEQGTFLNPAQGFMAQNVADNTTGQVQYAFVLLTPAPAVSGSGVIAKITFKAKAAGNALITLNTATLSNNQAMPITATLMSGSVTVLPESGPTPVPTAVPTAQPTAVPPPPGGFTYCVKWGDTLYSIARHFGVTIDAIVAANGLANPNQIRAGQVLIIPGVPQPDHGPTMYVVQPGDNLYRISLKFGVPIEAIVAVNHIVNPWYIQAGQVLLIPGDASEVPPPQQTYVVKPGDTVWSIAAKFRVTPWDIIKINNLHNPNLIFVGQELRIP